MGDISDGIYILTWQDLNARENAAFSRGVERGRLEEKLGPRREVAYNCKNWTSKGGVMGYCEVCGAQTQGMEVSGDFKCQNFTRRDANQ